MRKLSLLFMAMVASFALQAQWTNDASTNTFIADASPVDSIHVGEIHVMTDAETNDTYVQWTSGGMYASNGHAPALQRITPDGTPQWGENGIRFNQFNFLSWSQGDVFTITPDHDVISCFSTADTVTIALRLHPDGTYPWGEQGVLLFDGICGSRAEILAGNDGGAWALGADLYNLYLQYIEADGSLNPVITIEKYNDTIRSTYGKLVLASDNSVFLTYEQVYVYPGGSSLSGIVDIHLRGYTKDGTQTVPDTKLLGKVNNIVTYTHEVVPDGLGGAYVYIEVGDSELHEFNNIHVCHYDANGNNTISDTLGVTVHTPEQEHLYVDPYASVDPVSHDLLISYVQKNLYQREPKIFVNRITAAGERVWDEGVMVYENQDIPLDIPMVSTFEDGSGFSVIFYQGDAELSANTTIEAIGMDMNCNMLWQTTMSSTLYRRDFTKSIQGFNNGQLVYIWGNHHTGMLYGQNIGVDGSMGQGLDVEEIFEDGEIVNIERIFNVNGQLMQSTNLNELNTGVYIIQGTTESGKIVNKKTVIVKE